MSDISDGRRTAPTITLTAPKGYEFLVDCYGKPDFAYPKDDEFFLTDMGGVLQKDNFVTWREKRFILKKKVIVVPAAQQYTPPPQKTWTVQEVYGGEVTIPIGWKYMDFRPAASGENYMDSYRNAMPPVIQNCAGASIGPRIIVKRA